MYDLVTDAYGADGEWEPMSLEEAQATIEATCRDLDWPMPEWYECADGTVRDRMRNITAFIPVESHISNAARILGRKGGQARSEAKTRAVRENAKKGGRPRKEKPMYLIHEDMLGSEAAEVDVRRMVELLRERGYDVAYGQATGYQEEVIPDDVWQECLDLI